MARSTPAAELMTAEQRARFDRDGFLIIRLDVHPPAPARVPFRFDWHQDGGRQNREVETTPRPRLSVKLAYWLSDVSAPGRGNLTAGGSTASPRPRWPS